MEQPQLVELLGLLDCPDKQSDAKASWNRNYITKITYYCFTITVWRLEQEDIGFICLAGLSGSLCVCVCFLPWSKKRSPRLSRNTYRYQVVLECTDQCFVVPVPTPTFLPREGKSNHEWWWPLKIQTRQLGYMYTVKDLIFKLGLKRCKTANSSITCRPNVIFKNV